MSATRETGKRTRLRFGSVSAEVSLVKATTKPKAAEHETRRVLVEVVPPGEGDAQTEAYREFTGASEVRRMSVETVTGPFGDPVAVPEHDATIDTPDGPAVVDHKTAADRPATEAGGDGWSPDEYGATTTGGASGPLPTEVHEGELAHLPPGLLGPMGDPTWPTAVDADFEAEGRDDLEPEPPRPAPVTKPNAEPVPAEPDHEGAPAPVTDPAAPPAPTRPPVQAWPDGDPSRAEPIREPAPTYVPPATRVEQGVHLESGQWVDLTDRLAEVDTRTRVDGLEVVRTIPASSYASEHVRELHYLAGVTPDEYKVLALLWRALRTAGKAAEVRWTKRTAQARGIILARGELGRDAHLALLELEWAENVRKPSARVTGPIRADVSIEEATAALELVESFSAPAPRVELRDERLAKRAELLELARAGKLAEYVPPAEPMPEDLGDDADGLAEALELAAAWNREHAPA